MSSKTNQKQSFWKTVEAQLRSILAEGSTDCVTVLAADDAASWAKTLIINALIIQDLLPDGSRLRTDGSLKQWCIAIAKADILSVAKGLKEFQNFIRRYPDEWAFLSLSDFKHRYPYVFTGDFWSPVKDVLESFLANPVPATFVVLNQWISFPLKLTLKGMADDLTQKSEQEFLDNEARLAALDFPDEICQALEAVLKDWFSGFTYTQEFRPHHSNGAVANRDTKRGLYGKYLRMTSDYKIESLFRKFGHTSAEHGFTIVRATQSDFQTCAKFITVPKGIDKRRTICPEPAEYQFNQQGVWGLLDEYLTKHPVLSRHIAIHDQIVNQNAAIQASRFCNAATIDLSSASDSVSWRLIKRVFRGCPQLLWMLWATRSTHVKLPTGKIVRTEKYAPMGSALCFPIESILFAAICQVAEQYAHCSLGRESYHVYGDDIVVPMRAYEYTLRILDATGFLVNAQKSFEPYSRFKESCGIEALDGVDVTPIGISRKFSALPLSDVRPELVSCYVSLANCLYDKHYVVARDFVLGSILCMPQQIIPPFSWSSDLGIVSDCPTNWRANRRFNEAIQCEEIRVGCFTSTRDPDAFTSADNIFRQKFGAEYFDIKYIETLRRLYETNRVSLADPDDLIQVSLCKAQLRLVSRWLPAWWFELPGPPSSIYLDGEDLFFIW